jgi:hypothetical protein
MSHVTTIPAPDVEPILNAGQSLPFQSQSAQSALQAPRVHRFSNPQPASDDVTNVASFSDFSHDRRPVACFPSLANFGSPVAAP